jgi:hypothetical protein
MAALSDEAVLIHHLLANTTQSLTDLFQSLFTLVHLDGEAGRMERP